MFMVRIILVLVMPSLASARHTEMVLAGFGKNTYLGFITLYDAELFAQSADTYSSILNEDAARFLSLYHSVSLNPEELIAGMDAILKHQHTQEKLDRLRIHRDNLHNGYEDINSGESYSL